METTNEMARCLKCSGSGKYYFWDGRVEECFPCSGTGEVERSESKPRRAFRRTLDARVCDMRARYRNAEAGVLSYEDMVDPNGTGWTHEGLVAELEATGAREAFRAIGWPV